MGYSSQRLSRVTPAALALVAIVLVAIAAGGVSIHEVGKARNAAAAAFQARLDLQRYLTLIVDQETAVRAIDATDDTSGAGFLEPYILGKQAYPALIAELRNLSWDPAFSAAIPAIERADALHAQWQRTVAEPILAEPTAPRNHALEARGKQLVDAIRRSVAQAQDVAKLATLGRRSASQLAVATAVAVIVFFVIVVGVIALRIEWRRAAEQQRLLREIAERNAALERSNAALQEFAYVASHDLQEPLRTVASFTQLLQKRYSGKLGADADEFIGFAVDGAHRMQQLISDILAYSRVTTHGKPLEPVDLEACARHAVQNLGFTIDERGATVEIGSLPEVSGDGVQLTQLFQNLIGNAVKYGGKHPRVLVDARPEGEGWRIRVADNGIGIAPEYHNRVFRIFQRLHTRAEYSGTGVGLAICKGIVQRHGGRIWVESKEGEGASFYFTLKAVSMEMAEPA